MNSRKEIIDSLQPLFKRADRDGLWFYTDYQQLWFSPNELRKCHKEGRFVWGAENWNLRNPQERLNQIENEQRTLNQEKNEFLARMEKAKIKVCS